MKPRQAGLVSKNLPYNLSIQASGSGSELTAIPFPGGSRCQLASTFGRKVVLEHSNLPGAKE